MGARIRRRGERHRLVAAAGRPVAGWSAGVSHSARFSLGALAHLRLRSVLITTITTRGSAGRRFEVTDSVLARKGCLMIVHGTEEMINPVSSPRTASLWLSLTLCLRHRRTGSSCMSWPSRVGWATPPRARASRGTSVFGSGRVVHPLDVAELAAIVKKHNSTCGFGGEHAWTSLHSAVFASCGLRLFYLSAHSSFP